VDREAPGSIEPHLVAGAGERLEEREAVACGAVAEAVTLVVAMGSREPDELGAGENELFVEIVPCAREAPGQLARPSSRTACRARTSAVSVARAWSGSSRRRASVLPAAPCNVPRPR
jgi:hypothetical protein